MDVKKSKPKLGKVGTNENLPKSTGSGSEMKPKRVGVKKNGDTLLKIGEALQKNGDTLQKNGNNLKKNGSGLKKNENNPKKISESPSMENPARSIKGKVASVLKKDGNQSKSNVPNFKSPKSIATTKKVNSKIEKTTQNNIVDPPQKRVVRRGAPSDEISKEDVVKQQILKDNEVNERSEGLSIRERKEENSSKENPTGIPKTNVGYVSLIHEDSLEKQPKEPKITKGPKQPNTGYVSIIHDEIPQVQEETKTTVTDLLRIMREKLAEADAKIEHLELLKRYLNNEVVTLKEKNAVQQLVIDNLTNTLSQLNVSTQRREVCTQTQCYQEVQDPKNNLHIGVHEKDIVEEVHQEIVFDGNGKRGELGEGMESTTEDCCGIRNQNEEGCEMENQNEENEATKQNEEGNGENIGRGDQIDQGMERGELHEDWIENVDQNEEWLGEDEQNEEWLEKEERNEELVGNKGQNEELVQNEGQSAELVEEEGRSENWVGIEKQNEEKLGKEGNREDARREVRNSRKENEVDENGAEEGGKGNQRGGEYQDDRVVSQKDLNFKMNSEEFFDSLDVRIP